MKIIKDLELCYRDMDSILYYRCTWELTVGSALLLPGIDFLALNESRDIILVC